MGKTIEVNLPVSNLLDDEFRVADEKSIQSTSDTPSDLSASFSKKSIDALLNMKNCDGVRIYPAAYNNELIMVAWGTKGKDDLIGDDYFCVASNAVGLVFVDGAANIGGVEQIPLDLAESLIKGSGSDAAILDELNKIREIGSSKNEFKVLFDSSFFTASDYDEILFEVVDLKLQDTKDINKTITGSLKRHNNFISTSVSFLPCPPYCGGAYGAGINRNEKTT